MNARTQLRLVRRGLAVAALLALAPLPAAAQHHASHGGHGGHGAAVRHGGGHAGHGLHPGQRPRHSALRHHRLRSGRHHRFLRGRHAGLHGGHSGGLHRLRHARHDDDHDDHHDDRRDHHRIRALTSVLAPLVSSRRHRSTSTFSSLRSSRHGLSSRGGALHRRTGLSAGRTSHRSEPHGDPGHDAGYSEHAGHSEGWELLAEGAHGPALHAFARRAERRPGDGVPKLGYALAAAEAGELEGAAWAMRRVFRIDPDAAHRAPVDHRLEPRVRDLIHRYRDRLRHDRHAADSSFMVAALHHLLGEDDHAHEALRESRDYDDGRASTVALIRSLDSSRR